jgi:hypothetical protein
MNSEILGSFDLIFRPSLQLITVVRRFVQDFYQHTLDLDTAAQLGLATHELLENAVKYGVDREARLSIEIARDGAFVNIAIRTQNRASEQNIRAVGQLFEELAATGNPFDFYQSLMRKTSRIPGKSGLGLARVAVEADMSLAHELAGDQLSILAQCRVPFGSEVKA